MKLLVERRKTLGLSQQEVADAVGIDRSYYSKIENGLTPSVKVAKAISEILGVKWILFFEDNCAKNTQDKYSAPSV